MNETTELIMKQLNAKKVHAETHELGGGDEIDALKLKNIGSVVAKTISDPITGSMIAPGTVGASQLDPSLITSVDNVAVQMEFDRRGVNVMKYGAVGDGTTDDTAAIQAALDNHLHVFIPNGTYKHSGLTVSKWGQTITGDEQLYTESILIYVGSGTAITVGNAGYASFSNIAIKGVPSVATDYFNTGSVGVDVTAFNTSIVMTNVFLGSFETLVKSNYNSFYNKFINCRFERALTCLYGFADYNFDVRGCRFVRFHNAIRLNGVSGPATIHKNSFEIFNGAIVNRTGGEEGVVNFTDNYVEIYETYDLPTNFPTGEFSSPVVGKFGGNILFLGPYKTLNISGNSLLIHSVYRIVSASVCRSFRSVGNMIHLYTSGNNLNKMFSVPSVEHFYINDQVVYGGGTGAYSRTYSQEPLNPTSPYNESYFYDCVVNKELISDNKIYTPSLSNGWVQGNASYGAVRVFIAKEGLFLQGCLNGASKTSNVIFTLPADKRPFEKNVNKGYANLTCFTATGTLVRLRYVYSSGVLNLENTPSELVDINLDGLVIPIRI